MKNRICLLISLFLFFTSLVMSQAVWNKYQGPYSGNAYSFTSSQDRIFCGVDLSGIFKSEDNGATWQLSGIGSANIGSMYCWNSKIFAWVSNVVNVSNDNGENWSKCADIGWVNLFFSYKNSLFAGTSHGIFSYDDTKNVWLAMHNGLPEPDGNGLLPVRAIIGVGDKLYCGGFSHGLYSSVDEGKTWGKHMTGTDLDNLWIEHLACFNSKIVVVPDGVKRQLFISEDDGINWAQIDFVHQDNSFEDLVQFNGDLLLVTNRGIYKFSDKDLSFSVFSDCVFEKVSVERGLLFGSNQTGIYKWGEGEFELSNTGINSSSVYDIEFYNNSLYCATSGGTFFTSDDGETWNFIVESKGGFNYTVERSEDKLFIGAGGKGILSYSTEDNKWKPANNGLASRVIWEIKAINGLLYAATDAGLYISDNQGLYWKHIKNCNSQILNIAAEEGIVLVSPAYDMIYKVSEDRCSLESLVSLYKGINVISESDSSTVLTSFDDTNYIQTINVIDSIFYVSIGNAGLYISRDLCKTWERHKLLGVVNVSKRGGGNLYATSYGEIYYSPDEGKTWQAKSETGMPSSLINCIFQGENNMYAGTLGNSVYKRQYLTETDLFSEKFTVVGATLSGVPEGTSDDKIRESLTCSHGASVFVVPNGSAEDSQFSTLKSESIRNVKVVAEDGKTEKIYSVKSNTDVCHFVNLYPNPAKNEIFLQSPMGISLDVNIFNMYGAKVMQLSTVSKRVDISGLNKGLYIVEIRDSGNRALFKLLKE